MLSPSFADQRALARAATLIENRRPEAAALLTALYPRTGRALTLGITGAPGAGKSTLINSLIRLLRDEGQNVAVIAVDPSSAWTGGAILGDRVRMQDHHADPGVFIRSMATRGQLGGLAATTLDLTLLLDAAGADIVVIETVGVGQDEIDVARLAAVTAVVLVPGMGDDVQAMKAGVMEIADVYVINKSDHPGAEKLEREILAAQTGVPVVRCVASEGAGVDAVLAAVRSVRKPEKNAAELWRLRLREIVREKLAESIPSAALERAAEQVAARRIDPYSAAEQVLKEIR